MDKKQLARERLEAVVRALPLPAEELNYETRAMFGGHGLYAYGRIFGVIVLDAIGLKLSETDQALLFNEVPGSYALQFMPGEKPSRLYVSLPPTCWQDPELFRPWIERSITYAQAQPARK